IRIADILYSPQEVPYGLALGWNDKHLNQTKIEELCLADNPRDSLGSSYEVSVHFKSVETEGGVNCFWGPDEFLSNNIYKMRRTASLYNEEGGTERMFIDVYVYEPYASSP
ncbi:MAG: hypothetical protein QXH30_02470, partial [Candidatus Bilamarchaeaceae archaeon]